MSLQPFDRLPEHARLWIFAADRALAGPEQEDLAKAVRGGLREWAAHGSPVTWGFQVVHDRFLMIGVDETQTRLTGCSIDSAVARIRELEGRLGTSLLDNTRVFFRRGGAIEVTSRASFRTMAEAGEVDGDTPVFNNIIATVGELRGGSWETPARNSWHARAFPLGAGG